MGACLFIIAMICFVIGFVQLILPVPETSNRASAPAPLFSGVPRPSILDPNIPGLGSQPAERQQSAAPASAPASQMGNAGGAPVNVNPQKLNWIQMGSRIYVKHPVRGETMVHVLGKILYAELWQTQRGPQAPWVPTGNSFAGYYLEGGMFLLSWQNRVYLLDEATELSDAEIQQVFLPRAREFAQSNQTADVYFAYPPASWHIDDIGKFKVEQVEGEGFKLQQNAVGRFIHASGDSGRALVLEDYEGGGGGQDQVWTGYLTTEEEVRQA